MLMNVYLGHEPYNQGPWKTTWSSLWWLLVHKLFKSYKCSMHDRRENINKSSFSEVNFSKPYLTWWYLKKKNPGKSFTPNLFHFQAQLHICFKEVLLLKNFCLLDDCNARCPLGASNVALHHPATDLPQRWQTWSSQAKTG